MCTLPRHIPRMDVNELALIYRDQAGNRPSITRDDDLLAGFCALDELRELGLRLVHPDVCHRRRCYTG